MSSVVLTLVLFSCKKNAQAGADEKEAALATEQAVTYAVDSAQSEIKWFGYKVNQSSKEESGHHGVVKLSQSDSHFTVENDSLVSGVFIANMNSMSVTDMADDAESQSKLIMHLKADEFFGVEQFPVAKFELTKVTPLAEGDFNTELEGNLSIRDVTKNYKVKANTSSTDSTYSINTDDFIFDRQEFNIKFPGAGENLINDDVKMQIQIVGVKK